MSPKQFVRRSLTLTAEDWIELERWAFLFNCKAPSGTTAGQSSWRSLVKEIARGHLTLTRRNSIENVKVQD